MNSPALDDELAGNPPSCDPLPAYARRLLAYHREHEAELRSYVRALPLRAGDRVLDLGSGDGTFSGLLAERGARVWALDANQNYLDFARSRLGSAHGIRFRRGDARELPFSDGHFDGVFCAQSMYSFPELNRVLSEMRRSVRAGGWVAIVENDTLHNVVLPWPPDLELEVRKAERTALEQRSIDEDKFYIGRNLVSVLQDSGVVRTEQLSFSSQRRAPLSEDERISLTGYLREIAQRVDGYLPAPFDERLARLSRPSSPDFLLDQPGFSVTYLDWLCIGFKPGS